MDYQTSFLFTDQYSGKRKAVSECLSNFCKGFKFIPNKYKTMAHYTPDDDFLKVLKLYVRTPYMASSLAQFFGSKEYHEWAYAQPQTNRDRYFGEEWLIRTYGGETEVSLAALCEHGIERGKWCTVDEYRRYGEDQAPTYKKNNVRCRLQDIKCDTKDVSSCKLRVLSFDGEMPGGATAYSKDIYKFPQASEFDPPDKAWRYGKPSRGFRSRIKLPEQGTPEYEEVMRRKRFPKQECRDPVAVIGALVKDEGVHKGMDFLECKIFVYRNPDAESDTSDLFQHIQNVKEKLLKSKREFFERGEGDFKDAELSKHESFRQTKDTVLFQKDLETLKSEDPDFFSELLRQTNIGWRYEKVEVLEFRTEIDMIMAFKAYLHRMDVDILSGHNIDWFDGPYLIDCWNYHRHSLKMHHLGEFNLTCFKNGMSKLDVDKRGGKIINTDGYIRNDTMCAMAKEKGSKKLNDIANKTLFYNKDMVNNGLYVAAKECLVSIKKLLLLESEKDSEGSESRDEDLEETEEAILASVLEDAQQLSDAGFEAPAAEELRDRVRRVIAEKMAYKLEKTLEKECNKTYPLLSSLRSEELDGYCEYMFGELWKVNNDPAYAAKRADLWQTDPDDKDDEKFRFGMKKIECSHEKAASIWKAGGDDFLNYLLYNFVDCLLPPMILAQKAKFANQLGFTKVSGANFSMFFTGKMGRLVTSVEKECRMRHGGKFLFYDKGLLWYHYPALFRNFDGPCDRMVRTAFDLKLMGNVRKYQHQKVEEFKKQEEKDRKAAEKRAREEEENSLTVGTKRKRGAGGSSKKSNKKQKNETRGSHMNKLLGKLFKKILISEGTDLFAYSPHLIPQPWGPDVPECHSNQGGKTLDPSLSGLIEQILITLDAASMYPSIMKTDELAPENSITAPLLEYYEKVGTPIPSFVYTTFPLGSHFQNFAGDLIFDEKKAIQCGSENPHIKETMFAQSCDSVIPATIEDKFMERKWGKDQKAVWWSLFVATGKMEETDFKKAVSNPVSAIRLIVDVLGWYLNSSGSKITLDFLSRIGLFPPSPFENPEGDDLFFKEQFSGDRQEYLNRFASLVPEKFEKPTIGFVILELCDKFSPDLDLNSCETMCSAWVENWDAYQLEVKEFMNSLYGVFMMMYGPLSKPEISATTTAEGRRLLSIVQTHAEMQTTLKTKDVTGCFVNPWDSKPEKALQTKLKDGFDLRSEGNLIGNPVPIVMTPMRNTVGMGAMSRMMSRNQTVNFQELFKPYEALEVLYGDSVTGDTPVVLQDRFCEGQPRTYISRIDSIVDHELKDVWELRSDGKEVCFPKKEVSVWQKGGFTKVNSIIRHVCNKPIVRVFTETGIVDCTTDHSLLTISCEKISPNDAKKGDLLLHSTDCPVSYTKHSAAYLKEVAYSQGAFLRFGYYKKIDHDWVWGIPHSNPNYLIRVSRGYYGASITEERSPGNYFLTLRPESRELYILNTLAVLYNKNMEKKVNEALFKEKQSVIKSFLDGFGHTKHDLKTRDYGYDNSPTYADDRVVLTNIEGKELCAGIWLLYQKLDYADMILRPGANGGSTFDMCCSRTIIFAQFVKESIVSITKLQIDSDTPIYVYDLETETHHFHVGPGNLVVHNTDSVMIPLPEHVIVNREQAFSSMKSCTDSINGNLHGRLEFAPEKISPKTNLTTKQKTYDMMALLGPDKPIDWYFKGSDKEIVSPYIANFVRKCKKFLLSKADEGRDMGEILDTLVLRAKKLLLKFAMGKVPWEELTTTIKLGKYERGGKTQQNVIADKMIDRGQNVCVGESVTFVSILITTKNARGDTVVVAENEEIGYVLEHRNTITLNLAEIFEKKIKNFLLGFFGNVLSTLTDAPCAYSPFTSIRDFLKSVGNDYCAVQQEYASAVILEGYGDIYWRLDTRKKALLKNAEIDKLVQSGANLRDKCKVYECDVCYAFYKDKEWRFEKLRRILPEKHRNALVHVCPKCVDNKSEILNDSKKKSLKYRDRYAFNRVVCSTCIEMPMAPKPVSPENVLTPENCAFMSCPVHKRRDRMWTVLSDLDSIHFSVKAHHWLKYKEVDDSIALGLQSTENTVKIHTKDNSLDFRDLFVHLEGNEIMEAFAQKKRTVLLNDVDLEW
jgi:DNA polymerase elongation subunit (family B)